MQPRADGDHVVAISAMDMGQLPRSGRLSRSFRQSFPLKGILALASPLLPVKRVVDDHMTRREKPRSCGRFH